MQPWVQQVSSSYLLGLDWTIPRQFRELKGLEQDVRNLRKAMRSSTAVQLLQTSGELRTKLTVAEAKTERLRKRLKNFQVVPEYKELEKEANHITGQISDLNADNVADRTLVGELRDSVQAEDSPDFSDLRKIYEESGIVLPELPRRRFEEVGRFHQAVIQNRRSHLKAEISSAKRRIEARNDEKDRLDLRRRQIMEVLQSGGALEHYTRLREELGRAEGDCKVLREQLASAERIEATRTEVELKRTKLLKVLQDDIRERDEIVRDAILRFESLSQELYERAGSLTISATKNGPKFEVHIATERSKGITNMQIFCFDLMVAEMRGCLDRSPGFLIHDSHIFDGVDERQVVKAIQLGAKHAEASGFQYIVTFNSDAVPTDGFSGQFDLNEHVIPTRLTDATETGGLFGVRFN